MGCGGGATFDLTLVLINPPKYWDGGFGEVADETEEESYDLVDRFGDREYGLCDPDAAMLEGLKDQRSAARVGKGSTDSPKGRIPGSWRSRNMQTNIPRYSGRTVQHVQRVWPLSSP